jgi:DNA-directed RNA polymerase specialized sigma subunit
LGYQVTDSDARWADGYLGSLLRRHGLRGHDLEDEKQRLLVVMLDLARRWSPVFEVPFRAYAGFRFRREVLGAKRSDHHGLTEEMLPAHVDDDLTSIRERAARVRAVCRTEREREVVELLGQMQQFEVAQALGLSRQRIKQIVDRIRERVLEMEGDAG